MTAKPSGSWMRDEVIRRKKWKEICSLQKFGNGWWWKTTTNGQKGQNSSQIFMKTHETEIISVESAFPTGDPWTSYESPQRWKMNVFRIRGRNSDSINKFYTLPLKHPTISSMLCSPFLSPIPTAFCPSDYGRKSPQVVSRGLLSFIWNEWKLSHSFVDSICVEDLLCARPCARP